LYVVKDLFNNIFGAFISLVPENLWSGHQGSLHFHIFRRGLNSQRSTPRTVTEVPGNLGTVTTSATKQMHSPGDEHQCTRCGKVYRWKKSLNLHLRVECGKDPQFQCPACPYKAKQKGNLKSHMRICHSADLQVL
jgi:hypothetical protein